MSEPPFLARDHTRHPPAFHAAYRSSTTRSPRHALITFSQTLSELTGPVFGHDILGALDNDLIHNFAAGCTDRSLASKRRGTLSP